MCDGVGWGGVGNGGGGGAGDKFFDEPLPYLLCLFMLRFYGPINPMESCRAQSVYLTTRLLGRLSTL